MADLNIILSGFLGGFFGSVTSLVGVYVTQRAQEKRAHREFIRSVLHERLKRQEEAFNTVKRCLLSIYTKKFSFLELHDLVSTSVRSAFGDSCSQEVTELFTEIKQKPHTEHLPPDLAARLGAVGRAMNEMVEKTRRELGIPPLEGDALIEKLLKHAQEAAKASSPAELVSKADG